MKKTCARILVLIMVILTAFSNCSAAKILELGTGVKEILSGAFSGIVSHIPCIKDPHLRGSIRRQIRVNTSEMYIGV